MSEPIELAAKDPNERFRYSWSPQAGDTISGDPTLVVSAGSATIDGAPALTDGNSTVRFYLIGGAAGERTVITARANMVSGDIVEQTIVIPVVDSAIAPGVVSLAEAKRHLRVVANSEDDTVRSALISACEWVEGYTGVVLRRRSVTERLGAFTDHTRLRAWPVDAEETLTITYRDSVGGTQEVADAQISAASRPARIYPAAAARWPAAHTVFGDIEVTFTAGFADPADVPMILKRAILTMLTAFYEDREGGEMFAASEKAAMALCNRGNHRRRTL